MKVLRQDIKDAWLEGLADPNILQAEQALKHETYICDGEKTEVGPRGYCCLGVLGRVLNDKFPDVVAEADSLIEEFDDKIKITTSYPEIELMDPEESETEFPSKLWGALFVNDGDPDTRYPPQERLMQLNDNSIPFSEIAEVIRKDY